MCWRQVSKFQKSLLVLLFYLIVYLLISYALTPDPTVSFISEELRIGNKYIIMFLVAPMIPVYTDVEGADVFTSRNCGKCFITNNKGFLPMSEYDAVLVYGDRSLLSQGSAFMDPEKRYLIEAHQHCMRTKLKGKKCVKQARVTSFSSRETHDLCGLCDFLHEKRRTKKVCDDMPC